MAMINNQRVQQETMAKNTPKCVGNQRLPVDVPKKKQIGEDLAVPCYKMVLFAQGFWSYCLKTLRIWANKRKMLQK